MAERPHFAFPFGRGPSGGVRVVEQDELEHVDSCCQVIVHCPTGFRQERPEFGWEFPVFRNIVIDPSDVVDALRTWEPRSSRVRATMYADVAYRAVRHLSIDVEVE